MQFWIVFPVRELILTRDKSFWLPPAQGCTNLKYILGFGDGVTVVKNLQNVHGLRLLTEKVLRSLLPSGSVGTSFIIAGLSRFLGYLSSLGKTEMIRVPWAGDSLLLEGLRMTTAPSPNATIVHKIRANANDSLLMVAKLGTLLNQIGSTFSQEVLLRIDACWGCTWSFIYLKKEIRIDVSIASCLSAMLIASENIDRHGESPMCAKYVFNEAVFFKVFLLNNKSVTLHMVGIQYQLPLRIRQLNVNPIYIFYLKFAVLQYVPIFINRCDLSDIEALFAGDSTSWELCAK